jgi:hypothetical protein
MQCFREIGWKLPHPKSVEHFPIVSYWPTAHIPDVSSRPAHRNICTVGISFIWAFYSGPPIAFENCLEATQKPLSISQQLSYTLLALFIGCPIAFQSISQQLLV